MHSSDARPRSPRGSWWRSPWLPSSMAVVPTLLTIWSASAPGGYFGITLLALAGWMLTGVGWLVVAVLAAVALPRPRLRGVLTSWPLLTLPALVVVTLWLASAGVFLRATFEAHRPGLERLVAETNAAPGQRLNNQQVGLYAVRSASDAGGCTRITLSGAGFLSSTGFAHCAGQPPIDDLRGGEGTTYEPLDGPWYTFTFTW